MTTLSLSSERIHAMPWQTFPHDADIGVRGSGASLAEAFAGAATALTAAICDPATVAPR